MKKIISLFLCIFFAAIIMSCGKGMNSENIATEFFEAIDDSEDYTEALSVKIRKHYQGEYNSEKECQLINCTINSISLAEESEYNYEDLNTRLIAISDELNLSTMEKMQSCLSDAEESVGTDSDTFEIKELYYVRRADTNVFSFLLSEYLELDGVHPSYGYQAYNLDTATGNALELKDVVKDMDALVPIVKEQFKIYYPNSELFSEDIIEQSFNNDNFTINWTIDYTGLTIIYNTDDIASYEEGAFFIPISFHEYPELFQKKYMNVPICYGVEMIPGEPYYGDINNDDILDSVTVSANYEDDVYINTTIYVNDSMLEDSDNEYNYGYSPMYIHAWGASYVFVEKQLDNDYRCISCYEYNTDGKPPLRLGNFNGGRHEIPGEDSTCYTTIECLMNTAQFRLDTRTDVLSTVPGTRFYRVDNGLPRPESDNYDLQYTPIELTLLKDLTVKEIDRNTNGAKKVTLNKGTKLRYVATDGMKKAYLESDKEQYYEVELDSTDWPKTINDVDIKEIFEGIHFAG